MKTAISQKRHFAQRQFANLLWTQC